MATIEEFECRFLSFFHSQEEFPSPIVKTRGSFIYPSHLKASNKRRAPSPPGQVRKTEANPYLVNVNQLGPVLRKYATIPRKSTDTARVILTTEKTKLKASSSTSALRSMLRANISFSTKFDQRMFRTALKGKSKSSVGNAVSHDVLTNHKSDNPNPCAAAAEEHNQARGESICCKSEGEDNLHLEINDMSSSVSTSSGLTSDNKLVQAYDQVLDNCIHVKSGFHETSDTPPTIRNSSSRSSSERKRHSCIGSSNPPGVVSDKDLHSSEDCAHTRGLVLDSSVDTKVGVTRESGTTTCHDTCSNGTYYFPTASNFTKRSENSSDQICFYNVNGSSCNQSNISVLQSRKNEFEKSGGVIDLKCRERDLSSYYVKQSPIYEEVHVSASPVRIPDIPKSPLHRLSSDIKSDPHDVRVDVPPAPANSPVISSPLKPKASNQCGTLSKDISRKKKTPPPKPPRKRSLLGNTETEEALLPVGDNALLPVGLENDQRTYNSESFKLKGNWLMTSRNNSKFEKEVEAHDGTHELEHNFESSLEKYSPKQAQINSFASGLTESSSNASALVIEPHKSLSRRKKNTRKSAQSRAQQLSKSFRYLLVTKFGDFKLTGTTHFSRFKEGPTRNSRCSKRASFLSLREQMRPRSPTPKRVNSIRIPRVIIDSKPSGWENDCHSDDLCIFAGRETNELCQSSVTLCVSPKAKVETAYSSAEEVCLEKCCTLCTSLGFPEHYDSDEEDYINASSKSNLNQSWKVCQRSPEKKTRLC